MYDKASNIIEKYDARPGARQSLNHQYVYDGLNRLTEAKRGSGFDTSFTQAVGSQQWTLDHLGNHIHFNTDLTGNGQYTSTDDLQIAGSYNFANEIEELTKTEAPSITVACGAAQSDLEKDGAIISGIEEVAERRLRSDSLLPYIIARTGRAYYSINNEQ